KWLGVDSKTQVAAIFCWVIFLIFLPKFLGLARAILSKKIRESFGGFWAILKSAFLECLLSILLAPTMMVAHSGMVLSLLLGRVVGWPPQTRETDGTPWSDASRVHYPATLLGFFWLFVSLQIGDFFPIWMSPIWLGLILSIPISVWTSRVSLGNWLKKQRIFLIPEELNPPEILTKVEHAAGITDEVLDALNQKRYGAIAAVVDPYVNAVHVSLLEPDPSDEDRELVHKSLSQGLKGLTKDELEKLLQSSSTLLALHRTVWLSEAQAMHPSWSAALESYRPKMAGA
ncbi:MAG: hypothetical protein NZL93_01310, partial [Chthoniobacterales bacterium]|nr:hypothetical protein [Chthoniobacterales bacterium]